MTARFTTAFTLLAFQPLWAQESSQGPVSFDPAGPRSLYAEWSPDGTQLTFTSDRHGDREIYLMRADGSDVRRLTSDAAEDTRPRWSPDGRRIAFQSWRHGGGMEVYVMNAHGTDVRRLTFTTIAQ